jgi:hypothetical protein
MPNPAPIVVVQKKSGWGCVGTGCAMVLVLALLAAGALYFGGKQALQTLQSTTTTVLQSTTGTMLKSVTTTVPAVIPTADAGPTVYHTAQDKLDTFEQAFQRGQPATLHLNTDEINTLIARDPDWDKARGHVAVQLKDSTARLQASLDLSAMGAQVMAGRYLNVDSTLGISFDPATQRLAFDVQSIDMNGQTAPAGSAATMNSMMNLMVNQQLQNVPGAHDVLARVQKADIENSELVIETK